MLLYINITFDVFYIIITYSILYRTLSNILSVHVLPNALTYFSQGYSYCTWQYKCGNNKDKCRTFQRNQTLIFFITVYVFNVEGIKLDYSKSASQYIFDFKAGSFHQWWSGPFSQKGDKYWKSLSTYLKSLLNTSHAYYSSISSIFIGFRNLKIWVNK